MDAELTLDPQIDGPRIARQMVTVRTYMLRHLPDTWLTLAEIEYATGYPQASISARLRDLRKPKFGGWEVRKRRRKPKRGTWEYNVRSSFRLEG